MQTNRIQSIKAVQNIKINAGNAMRIRCLEMEKARKNKEKIGAQKQIDMINQRLMEIEKEKTYIQCPLGAKPSTPETGVWSRNLKLTAISNSSIE